MVETPLTGSDELGRALVRIDRLASAGLTRWIGGLEATFEGADAVGIGEQLGKNGVDEDLLAAALLVKRTAGQVNVLIHAVGILVALPKLLEPGEVVESLSLGAGNTGRDFDLITDRRIAEFTFIDWRGGSESIRQNKLFGDLVALLSAKTRKRRIAYVNGTTHPLRFLGNRRAIRSVLKDAPLERRFRQRYGEKYATVGDFWEAVKSQVEIVDLAPIIPSLTLAPREPS